ATDLPGGAVQFPDSVTAGELMQPIDVLRNDTVDPALLLPGAEHLVAGVGLGLFEFDMRERLLPPVLLPGRRAGEKVVEVDRLRRRPDPAGRAKVGDAALGADPRPGEGDRPAGLGQPAGDFGDTG